MKRRLTAACLLATTFAFSTSAEAFEVKHAAGGALVRWQRANVAWTVDPSVERVPGAAPAIRAALASWTQRGEAPTLSLVLAAPSAQLEPGLDGTNGIFYAPQGFAPAGAALAVTLLSFDDDTGEVLDADVVLNGKYELGPVDANAREPQSKDEPGAQTYDIGRVMAHEMGHALGLSDEPAHRDALMYPYVPRARALSIEPGSDDLLGLQTLYVPRTAFAAGSLATTEEAGEADAGCTIARARPRAAPFAALAAAGVAISALLMARSRGRGGARAAGITVMAAGALVIPLAGESGGGVRGRVDASETPAAAHAGVTYAPAVVTAVRTTSVRGIFRSEIDVAMRACAAAECPPHAHAFAWGGTLGGVRQVIGGFTVPSAGAHVRVAFTKATTGTEAVQLITGPGE